MTSILLMILINCCNCQIIINEEFFFNNLKIKNEKIYNGKYNCLNETINLSDNNKIKKHYLKRFLLYDFKIENHNDFDYINLNKDLDIEIFLLNSKNKTIKSNKIKLNLLRDTNCIDDINRINYYNGNSYKLTKNCFFIKKNDMYTECQFMDITDIKSENLKLKVNFLDQIIFIDTKINNIKYLSKYSLLQQILIIILFPIIFLILILIPYFFNNSIFK